MIYQCYIKRILSIIIASITFIITSPIMLVAAILVRIKLGSPVMFKQERPGLHGKIFVLYKFRTMTNGKDKDGMFLPDKQRQTPLGNFLRKTSIDELPELYNILKGDMAIIGPRPLLVKYLDYYTEEQNRRHNVRPGLVNLSAIKGRNAIPWEERLKLDVWYADNVSFVLDVYIFIKAFGVVLLRKGTPDGAGRKGFDKIMEERNSKQ